MTEHEYLLANGFTITHEDVYSIVYNYLNRSDLVVYKKDSDKYIVEMTELVVDFKLLLHIYSIDKSEYLNHKKIENRQSIINKIIKLC